MKKSKKIICWIMTFFITMISFSTYEGNSFVVEAAGNSNIVAINWGDIAAVGNQEQGSEACACFSLAYCRTILDKRVHYWNEYDAYGNNNQYNCAAVSWGSAGYNRNVVSSPQEAYKGIYDSINAGRPAILNVAGSRTSDHFVTIVGYEGVNDVNNLSAYNFLMIDSCWMCPKNATENLGGEGYYALNDGGYHYYIANSGSAFSDTERPVISDAKIFNVTSDGYDVSFRVSDNTGVTKAECPTWTSNNGQDDLIWHSATISNGVATCHINRNEHNGEYGEYITHCYAWDASGNNGSCGLSVVLEVKQEEHNHNWVITSRIEPTCELDGKIIYTCEDKETILDEYGSWSDWSSTQVTASDTRQVETRNIAATYKTEYNYNKWSQYNSATSGGWSGPSAGYWGGYYCGNYIERGWSAEKLNLYSWSGDIPLYGRSGDTWYNESSRQVETSSAYTQYRYRDKVITVKGCGSTKEEIIPALGHDWDEGTITQKPTLTKEGVITYTCKICQEKKNEPIKKLQVIKEKDLNINIFCDDKAVNIVWTDIEGASKYRIFKKDVNGTWNTVKYTTSLSYKDTAVEEGKTYTYGIRCMDNDGKYLNNIEEGTSIQYVIPKNYSPQISLKNDEKGVVLTWEAIEGATKYRIYKKDADGTWKTLKYTTGLSYKDTTVEEGNTYTYGIRCMDENGKYLNNLEEGTSVEYVIPKNYTPEISIKSDEKGVVLTWEAIEGATKYRIYKKDADGTWKTLKYTTGLSYKDTTVEEGNTYTYGIRCMDENGKYLNNLEEGTSIEYIIPKNYTPKISLKKDEKGVELTWEAIEGANKYRIYRKEADGTWKTIKYTTGLSYKDTSVKEGNTYTYGIRCMDENGKYLNNLGDGEKIEY